MTRKVRHMNPCPPETREFVIEDLQNKYGLKGQPLALFEFYALNCEDEFTPSDALTERKTGIGKGNVSRVRKTLIDMHLITMTKDAIILDWDQLIDIARQDESVLGSTQAMRRAGIQEPMKHYAYEELPRELQGMYLMHQTECNKELRQRDSAADWIKACIEVNENLKPVTYEEIVYKASVNKEVMKRFINGAVQFPDPLADKQVNCKFKRELLENPDWPEEDFEPVPF